MKYFIWLLAAIFLLFPGVRSSAQVKPELSKQELETYKKKVTELVDYFEETLNFLGDPASVNKEREIIVNDSYLKMFVNDKVQIEDDLDEYRDVPINKDVQAYLKDIGFFFRKAKFEFVVSEINHFETSEGLNYFKVSLNRILDAVTVMGDTIHSRKARFMEINLNIPANTLKIASIYTTRLDEKEENRLWWINLPQIWKDILGAGIILFDSVEMNRVTYFEDSVLAVARKMELPEMNPASAEENSSENVAQDVLFSERQTVVDTLIVSVGDVYKHVAGVLKLKHIDISGNNRIRNLSPLNELTELEEIFCQNTIITDLVPIRNLNHLEILDFSETPVDDISPMHYSTTLKELNCSYTLISDLTSISGLYELEVLKCDGLRFTDLEFVSGLTHLKTFSCSNSRIYDLSPLISLKNLTSLDISGTNIQSLDTLAGLTGLTYLNCEHTRITSLEPVSGFQSLEILRISNTAVASLEPLKDMTTLTKIYCDNTGISKNEAIQFMRDHPACLVIFESSDLLSGWQELESGWKSIARKYAEISEQPTQEELHVLLTVKKMDISGNREITTLEPLKWFINLTSLNASSIDVADFSPVSQAIELEYLDISDNPIDQTDFLSNLSQLHIVKLENTGVSTLKSLENKQNLKYVYADNSKIADESAFNLTSINPGCVVVYKTEKMNSWWRTLPDGWNGYFRDLLDCDSTPSKDQLHEILYLDSLSIASNTGISDIEPITMIRGLKKLSITGTSVSDLQPLSQMAELEEIRCNQSPVSNLTALSGLQKLRVLNIENTPVSDLEPIGSLTSLESLNCSGTQIRSLKAAESLVNLREIKLNNTSIKSIKPLFGLPLLRLLECFNTDISVKTIEKFKETKPDCKVVFY